MARTKQTTYKTDLSGKIPIATFDQPTETVDISQDKVLMPNGGLSCSKYIPSKLLARSKSGTPPKDAKSGSWSCQPMILATGTYLRFCTVQCRN